MRQWNTWLTWTGNVVGAVVIVYGIARFAIDGLVIPLLVSVAIIIVGPLEDILIRWVKRQASSRDEAEVQATFIDLSTSLAFLILLGIVIMLAGRAS